MEKHTISRVTRSKTAARANYDRLSRFYDLLTAWSEGPLRRAGIALLRPAEGERVLEIGFGTGSSLVEIARAVGATGQVHGIDLSPRMHARAADRLRQAGLQDRTTLFCEDALEAALDEAAYDAVFMSFTLELFDTPEIPTVLAACRRALRPDGRICVVALSQRGGGAALRFYDWAHEQFPVLVDCRPIFPAAALETAGFEVWDVREKHMFGLPVEVIEARKSDF